MTDRLRHISVIIVNYGTPYLTIAGVQSVLDRQHSDRVVDIHVVENGSPDDSASVLQAAHATQGWNRRVTLYLETENHGFGRGNNIALKALSARQTPPDAIFFLNPDAFVQNEAIDALASALEVDPRAGFAGAAISHPDGTGMTAAFRFPSVISQFSDTLCFGPVARLCRRWTVPLPPDHPAGPVDWVSGAAVMGRFTALRDLGFFDPRFFLYYEEVDLMHRAMRVGWRTLYVPGAQVGHSEGTATGFADQRLRAAALPNYHYASWVHYMHKTHGRAKALLMAAARIVGACGHIAICRLRRRNSTLPTCFFADFWTLCVKPLLRGAP